MLEFKIMLQNFRSTRVNYRSIQYIYRSMHKSCRSIRSEEYKSDFTPRSEDLRFLLARSNFKFKKIKINFFIQAQALKDPAKNIP